jgi:hypothetical protein
MVRADGDKNENHVAGKTNTETVALTDGIALGSEHPPDVSSGIHFRMSPLVKI